MRTITLVGLDGQSGCAAQTVAPRVPFSCVATATVPANAPLTGPYWERPEDAGRATFAADAPFGLPFRPTPFKVRLEMGIGGIAVNREVPVQFRYEGAGLVGEKRMELNVVPAFAVSVSPQIVVVPLRRRRWSRQCRPRAARDRRQRRQGRGVGARAAEDAGRMDAPRRRPCRWHSRERTRR